MQLVHAHIPQISISPAPPEEPAAEPYSPFPSALSAGDDTFRPQHLTPPPTLTRFERQPSPLRSSGKPTAKGLEREQFEALLQATRERNSGKKTVDLRREVALKVHKNKQVERRALFLSKVQAPPSPTATLTPKTPPESPAIFHYSLPSPGLVSPLALFESLNEDPTRGPLSVGREPWVEQVDFRVPEYTTSKSPQLCVPERGMARVPVPSLDQISARLNSVRQQVVKGNVAHRPTRLPAFLTPRQPPIAKDEKVIVGTGRLQIPIRARKSVPEPLYISPPKSPVSPKLQVTTLVVSRSAAMSPTKLSEINLLALNSRERKAQDMLVTLRRRALPPSEYDRDGAGMGDRRLRWKRHSAPADLMPLHQRTGFEHPVFSLPGGF